jgi:hypothetical protein
MTELLKTIMVNAKGNKVATAFGVVAGSCFFAGDWLVANNIEPWGTALKGVAAFIAIGLGFAVPKLSEKSPEEK